MGTRAFCGVLAAGGSARALRPRLAHALLLTLALAACGGSAAAKAPTPPARTVVFLGDSLTVGLYATTIDRSYASLLAVSWHATLLSRVGIAGVHAVGLLDSIATLRQGATDAVVEVGTNDFGVVVLADFEEAYRAVISAVQRQEPKARLVCLGVWRGATDRTPWGQGPEAYNDVIRSDCPGQFVDMELLYMDPANRGPARRTTFQGLSDGFHPNDTGHAAIAAAIRQAEG